MLLAPCTSSVALLELVDSFICSIPGMYQRKLPAELSMSQFVFPASSKTIRGVPSCTPISRRSNPCAVWSTAPRARRIPWNVAVPSTETAPETVRRSCAWRRLPDAVPITSSPASAPLASLIIRAPVIVSPASCTKYSCSLLQSPFWSRDMFASLAGDSVMLKSAARKSRTDPVSTTVTSPSWMSELPPPPPTEV